MMFLYKKISWKREQKHVLYNKDVKKKPRHAREPERALVNECFHLYTGTKPPDRNN